MALEHIGLSGDDTDTLVGSDTSLLTGAELVPGDVLPPDSTTGTFEDFRNRLYALLPLKWFPDLSEAPILGSLLGSFAVSWAWLYDRLRYTYRQTRLSTATEQWLDLLANDYLGSTLQRRLNETDDTYRIRITNELVRPRDTRTALDIALYNLTGYHPRIFEPRNPHDAGGYNVGQSMGYGAAGGYGSMQLPFQVFIDAYLPISSATGVSNVGGWGNIAGLVRSPAGYGIGAMEYASASQIEAQISAADVYETVAGTMAAGTIGWTRTIDPFGLAVSPSGTVLVEAIGVIIDLAYTQWRLTLAKTIEFNVGGGWVAAGYTANVELVLYWDGNIYQRNTIGDWYVWGGGPWIGLPDRDPR